jgi:hypothetical protein
MTFDRAYHESTFLHLSYLSLASLLPLSFLSHPSCLPGEPYEKQTALGYSAEDVAPHTDYPSPILSDVTDAKQVGTSTHMHTHAHLFSAASRAVARAYSTCPTYATIIGPFPTQQPPDASLPLTSCNTSRPSSGAGLKRGMSRPGSAAPGHKPSAGTLRRGEERPEHAAPKMDTRTQVNAARLAFTLCYGAQISSHFCVAF